MAKQAGRPSDPLIGFMFCLKLGDRVTGYFSEVAGVGSEHEVIEHKVVTDAGHELVQKIPGRLKWGDVTLKRGITDNLQIWEWRDNVIAGTMDKARQNCSILMYDRNYAVAAQWDFDNAWPSKVTGPNIKADSNEYAVEEVVLVHEGMKRVKV